VSAPGTQLSRSSRVALVVGSMIGAGIYAYAKAGFGNYMGFTAALGYWVA
jgi:amino acid transporter